DELVGGQRVLAVRGVARRQMKVPQGDGPLTARASDVDDGVEGDQRDREVARVGRDARVADAEDGVPGVDAAAGVTSAARLPLVASVARSAPEVAAPGALQQVAAERGHVAELL